MKKKSTLIIITSILLVAIITFSVIFFGFYLPDKIKAEEMQQMVKQYYANKLSLYQTENESYEDYEVDVAFLGDSLTDGYNLNEYYPQFVTANRGIGGETTIGLESRMQVSVYDLKPKVAVMLIGGNNLDTMFSNYENILIGLKTNLPNTKVVLVSLTAMGRDWAYKNKLACYNNVGIKKLANKYGFTYVDIYTPLFNVETGELYAEYTNDGVHFTAPGYQVVTQTLTPVLTQLLSN